MSKIERYGMVVVLVGGLLASSTAAQITVWNEDPKFSLFLPSGFRKADKETIPGTGDLAYLFVKEDSDTGRRIFVGIKVYDSYASPGTVTDEQMKKENPALTVEHEKWYDFDLPVARVTKKGQIGEMVVRNIMIPIHPHSIRLSITGFAQDDAEMASLARSLLSSVTCPAENVGESTSLARAAGQAVGSILFVLFVVFVIGLLRKRRKPGPPPFPSALRQPSAGQDSPPAPAPPALSSKTEPK